MSSSYCRRRHIYYIEVSTPAHCYRRNHYSISKRCLLFKHPSNKTGKPKPVIPLLAKCRGIHTELSSNSKTVGNMPSSNSLDNGKHFQQNSQQCIGSLTFFI